MNSCIKCIKNYFYSRLSYIFYWGKRKGPQAIPDQLPQHKGRKTLVLDLDETFAHSSFTRISNADHQLDLYIDGLLYKIWIKVRPGAEQFIKDMARHYEIFIFTASMSEYANAVIDKLDPEGHIAVRLYRENCTSQQGMLVKDLSTLNRKLKDVIILDVRTICSQLSKELIYDVSFITTQWISYQELFLR